MSSTQISKGFEILNPGLLDKRQGPYPTTAIACQKIPDTTKLVEGVQVNYRDGITVLIGTEGTYDKYGWRGGFTDDHLVRIDVDLKEFEDVKSKTATIVIDDQGNFNLVDDKGNVGLQLDATGLFKVVSAYVADLLEVNKLTIGGIPFDLNKVISTEKAGAFTISDENGYVAAQLLSGNIFQFVELLTGIISTDKFNLKDIRIETSPVRAFELVDANGYIGFAVGFDGTILGTGSSSAPPATTMPSNGTLEVMAPKRIYSLYNNLSGEKKSCYIYLDHLVKLLDNAKNNIRFLNGSDKVQILPKLPSGNTISETIDLSTVKADWDALTMSTNSITTKASVLSTYKVILMANGDSQTFGQAASFTDATGTNDVYWMQMLTEFKKLAISNPGFKMALSVGNIAKKTRTFLYNGANQTVEGWVNAVSGTSILSWLKHTEITSRMRDGSQGAWDLLGLGNGSGADWANTTAQRRSYAAVCEGQNAPTLTGALYAWLGLGTPSVTSSGITLAEQNAITTKCLDRLNNPSNPYFDKNKTGLHRYSIDAWLSRYKTLANDGETRLVVGSTAGSRVSNVNAFDVCLPTHVLFRFMDNEREALGVLNKDLYSQLMQLAVDAVKEEYPNMPVFISGLDTRSTYFPELYPNFSIPKKVNSNLNGNWAFCKQLYTDFYTTGKGVNEDANKAWILPMFWTDPTAWGWNLEPVGNATTDNPLVPATINDYTWKVRDNADAVHPGGFAHNDWGHQLISLIAYSLTV